MSYKFIVCTYLGLVRSGEGEGDERVLLEVLGLEELSDLLERLLLFLLVLVVGRQTVSDGALELHTILGPLDLLDYNNLEHLLNRSCICNTLHYIFMQFIITFERKWKMIDSRIVRLECN